MAIFLQILNIIPNPMILRIIMGLDTRLLAGIIIASILGGAFFILIMPNASSSVSKVTIDMDAPTSKEANMEYGTETTVEFTGKITISSLGDDVIVIALATVGSLPDHVQVSFQPSIITIDDPGTQRVIFTVLVALDGEIEGEVPISIGIQGKWHKEGSTTVFTTNSEHVEVRPTCYYGLALGTNTCLVSGPCDGTLAYSFNIESLSNVDVDPLIRLKKVIIDFLGDPAELNLTTVSEKMITFRQSDVHLPHLSTRKIDITLDGKEFPLDYGVAEITINATIKGMGIVEEMALYVQCVSDRLVLFTPGKSLIIAAPWDPDRLPKISDIMLPEYWDSQGDRLENHSPEIADNEDTYRFSLVVLLIGEPREVSLEVADDNDYGITWEPDSLKLTHLETGVFNITVSGRGGKAGDDPIQTKNIIEIRPVAEDSRSTRILLLVPQLNGEDSGITVLEAVAVGGAIFIIGALGLGSMEFSRYRFLTLFFFPLYSHIHEENALDHFTRGRIYQFIKDNPGVHYSRLRKELDLNNGVLSYHLHTLQRVELIKSSRSGIRKLFFITGSQVPDIISAKLNYLETTIRQIILENPGISQQEIGKRVPQKSQRTISHYVKKLSRKDYIYTEKDGKQSRCFPVEA